MNIIKIILYPSPLAPFFGKEEDLKLRCKLEWPYAILGKGMKQNHRFGGKLELLGKLPPRDRTLGRGGGGGGHEL